MPNLFTSKSQKLGEIGENLAVAFLMKRGFKIRERNFTRKCGELDIVAENKGKLYFIEVKSISKPELEREDNVRLDTYRPEDNMHPWKVSRLSKTVQIYLLTNNIAESLDWQVDLLVVFIDIENKKAQIKVVSNIIL